MKKITAFFDIDGTLYRDSLLIEHFKKLIKYDLIDQKEWLKIGVTYKNWEMRQGNYDDYLHATSDQYMEVIKGLEKTKIDFTSDQVIKLKADRVYKYTRSRIEWHKTQGHNVIFISGSPDFLVEKMAKKYRVDDFIGSTYLTDEKNRMTGDVIPMWDSDSKNKALDKFIEKYDIDMENSYAYGDTNGDITMLMRVGNPIAINPTKELLKQIKSDKILSKKTKIFIERKDVIFETKSDIKFIDEL